MVRIIKEGTRKTQFCDICGCYFSYDAEDVNVETESISQGVRGIIGKKYINCPQCNTKIILEDVK